MQLHCLVELKLERESIEKIPSLSSSLTEVFYFEFLGVKKMDSAGSSLDRTDNFIWLNNTIQFKGNLRSFLHWEPIS